MKNGNIFQKFWILRLNYNLQTCYNKSVGFSHDELRAVTSVQIVILHRTSSERQLKYKKKEMDQDKILAHSRFNGKLKDD